MYGECIKTIQLGKKNILQSNCSHKYINTTQYSMPQALYVQSLRLNVPFIKKMLKISGTKKMLKLLAGLNYTCLLTERWEVGGHRWEVGGGRWAVTGGRWAVTGGR